MNKTTIYKIILFFTLLFSIVLMAGPFGVRVNWPLYIVSSTIIVILLLYLEFEEQGYDARMISLLAVMSSVTVVSRQIIHGVEFSPVFFLAIVIGYRFGFIPGFAVGSMVMLLSSHSTVIRPSLRCPARPIAS